MHPISFAFLALTLLAGCSDVAPDSVESQPRYGSEATHEPAHALPPEPPAPSRTSAAPADHVEGESRGGRGNSPEEVVPGPAGALRLNATIDAQPDQVLRFGVVYRLAHAVGLPGIHIHGRPTAVGTGRHAVVISYAGDTSAWADIAVLRPALWLIEQDADGTTRRVAEALIPHIPAEGYHAVAVGEAPEGNGFQVLTSRVDDLDHDEKPELELVIRVEDEMSCGLGLISHRFFMIYNIGDTLTLAADIPLSESSYRGPTSRGTVRWEDLNADGHPDLNLRLKTCTEGSYAPESEDGCLSESTTYVPHHWDPEEDRWHLGSNVTVPCA